MVINRALPIGNKVELFLMGIINTLYYYYVDNYLSKILKLNYDVYQ